MMMANHVRPKQSGIRGLSDGETVKELQRTKHEIEDLYREQYVDERGGAIILSAAEISLHIPPGALKERKLISIKVKSGPNCLEKNNRPQASLTPIITCKPHGQIFSMPVEIVVPHCAVFHNANRHKVTAEFHKGNLNVIEGNVKEDVKCILKEKYCHIYTNHFSDIKLFISGTQKKRFRMVAFQGASSWNVLLLRVWLINDLPSEYMLLQREHKGCDFVPFDNYATFLLDYQLQYLVECKTSFQGNRINPFIKKKTLQNKRLFCTSKNCLVFRVDKGKENRHPKKISITIFQTSSKEAVCRLRQKVLYTTDAEGPQDRLSQRRGSLAASFGSVVSREDDGIRSNTSTQNDGIKTTTSALSDDLELFGSLKDDGKRSNTSTQNDDFESVDPQEDDDLASVTSLPTISSGDTGYASIDDFESVFSLEDDGIISDTSTLIDDLESVGSPEDDRHDFESVGSQEDDGAEKTPVGNIEQLVHACEKMIYEILNSSLSEVSNVSIFSEELIKLLYDVAAEAEVNKKKKNIGVIAGSAAGVISGGLTIAGIALFPATFGLSTGFLAAGIAAGVTASSVNLSFTLDKWRNDNTRKMEIKEKLKESTKFHMNLIEVATVLFICKDLVELTQQNIATLPDRMKLLEGREFGYFLSQMKRTHQESSVQHLFQFMDDIKQQCETLKQIFQFLGEKTNTTVIEKMFKALNEKPHETFALYAMEMHRFAPKNRKTLINFAKKYFELQNVRESSFETVFKAGIDGMDVGARIRAVVSSVAVGAMEVTDDLARLGGVTLRVFSVFSAMSSVLGAVGLSFDVAFLGHAIYDLFKSGEKKEDFSQSLIDLANMMRRVNSIEL